jgi:hypothetical protein
MPEPGRFRCLVCRKYVTGTPSGHCPQCGFVPPKSLEIPSARVRPWAHHVFNALLVVVLVGALVLLFWL